MSIDLEKIQDSNHLMELLIQLEDVLDSLDIYVYRNWINGEVVEGPIISRHSVSFSLLYRANEMPDPKAAIRLLKHGIKIGFSKVSDGDKGDDDQLDHEENVNGIGTGSQASDAMKTPEDAKTHTHWLVKITVPKRLLDQMSAADLSAYDDDVDVEEVQDAKDSGLTDTSAYQDGSQSQSDQPNGQPPNDQAPMPSQPGAF